jgi:hypothetical protein
VRISVALGRGTDVPDAFGDQRLAIAHQPARYITRDPCKTALVDLDPNSSISFGESTRPCATSTPS